MVDEYYYHQQGGYTTDGRVNSGDFAVLTDAAAEPDTTSAFSTAGAYAANKILDDAWNFNLAAAGGQISLALESEFISSLSDSGTTSGFYLATGPVVDQTFASGGSAVGTTPVLAVGGSDYSSYYDNTGKSEVKITANANGAYDLTNVGFGKTIFGTEVPVAPS